MARRTIKRARSQRTTHKATRKGPAESATAVPEGTIRRGNDGGNWVSVRAANRVQRWVPVASATLHGLRRLTVDDVTAGKPLTFFERGSGEPMWPTSVRGLGKTIFHPNGDLLVGPSKKRHIGWLRTRTPAIRDHTLCLLDGRIVFNPGSKHQMEVAGGLQIDSLNKKLVSSNITNVEGYIVA
jgi:hypothetical protein